ncbi:YrzI family protein [Bacillus glycinifermentans]|nr:YrzI family protein [Bacillus glycinifermentans]
MTIDLFFSTLTIRQKCEIEEIYDEMKKRQLRYLYPNSRR